MLSVTNITTQTINSTLVETEIFLINLNVLAAIDSNESAVAIYANSNTEVNGTYVIGSPMTLANAYYTVWQGNLSSTVKTSEMNKVIDYFTKLGYTINRKSDNGISLYWLVNW